jgi:hypothetical protein
MVNVDCYRIDGLARRARLARSPHFVTVQNFTIVRIENNLIHRDETVPQNLCLLCWDRNTNEIGASVVVLTANGRIFEAFSFIVTRPSHKIKCLGGWDRNENENGK